MIERPALDKHLDSKTFRDFYYLKEELIDFCRKNGLPVAGGKLEIADRIAYFLDTGKVLSAGAGKKKAAIIFTITEDTEIEVDFACSERHRAYYQILEDKKKGKSKIDRQFEYNTYIRDFFADNQGKSLEEAIKCWKCKKQLPGHNRYERSDLAALE